MSGSFLSAPVTEALPADVVCTSAGPLKRVGEDKDILEPNLDDIPRPFKSFDLSLQTADSTISLTQSDSPEPAAKKSIAKDSGSAGSLLQGACTDGRFHDTDSDVFSKPALRIGSLENGWLKLDPNLRRAAGSPAAPAAARAGSAQRPRKSRTGARSREASTTPPQPRQAGTEDVAPPQRIAEGVTDVPRENIPVGENGEQPPPPEQQAAAQGNPQDDEKTRQLKLLAQKQEEFTKSIPLSGPSKQLPLLANCALVHVPQRFLGRTPFNKQDAAMMKLGDDDIMAFGMEQDVDVLENAVDILHEVMKLYRRCQAPAQRISAILRTWDICWQDRFRALPLTVMLAMMISRASKHSHRSFFAFSQD